MKIVYSVAVLGSNCWRFAYETSLQACLAMVDGLHCDYRVRGANGSELLAQTGSELQVAKLCGKPLRDYRYLQGKRVEKQALDVRAAWARLQELATFGKTAVVKVAAAPAELPAVAAVADDWQPVREALQTRSGSRNRPYATLSPRMLAAATAATVQGWCDAMNVQ